MTTKRVRIMNALETYICDHDLNPIFAMNDLQDAKVISDNAVAPSDVSDGDCVRAVKWLVQERGLF